MRHKLYSYIALLLFLAGCGGEGLVNSPSPGNGSPKPAEGVDYFPLESGMVLVYGNGAAEIRVPGPAIRTVYGPAYALEGLQKNRVVRKQDDGKVLELRGDSWQVLFDLGVEEGASWTVRGEDDEDLLAGAKMTVRSRSETVTVPYGRFENVIHLGVEPRGGLADAGMVDLWFAPGVGIVKWEEVWFGGIRSFELTGVDSSLPSDEVRIGIRGQITAIETPEMSTGQVLGTLRVEGAQASDTMYDRALVTIPMETRIWRDGRDRRQAGFADLKTGQIVEVWFMGPVLESYPVQATAAQVVILE